MSTAMGLPLQAHTNVRDVLAPLFSNGRSFSSLIDELSRHFKLEPGVGSSSRSAYGDDPAGVVEASSESQSTDSEAEGNMSDEVDSRRVQARVSVQTRSYADATVAAQETLSSVAPELPQAPPTPRAAAAAGVLVSAQAPPAAMRKTRSRSRRQQQQQPQQQEEAPQCKSSTAADEGASSKKVIEWGERKAAGGRGRGEGEGEGEGRRGLGDGVPLGRSGGAATTIFTASGVGVATPSRRAAAGGSGTARARGFVSADDLTVLSVTANADGWSEAVGAALATRARAGYVFAQEVDPNSPQSTEFVREVFFDERSGARKALELRMRLIPVAQKVLLCSAWVDSGEYLAAAARLVALCQAEVFGVACVRFEQNQSTEGLVDRFNLFAKSMPKGSVPSLNVGMKSCIPASITKGLHGYTYNRAGGRPSGGTSAVSRAGGTLEISSATGVDGGGSDGGGDGATPPQSTETRQDRARKRRRRGSASDRSGTDAVEGSPPLLQNACDATASATATATAAAAIPAAAASPTPTPTPTSTTAPDVMEEDSMMPATEEASAGEGLAEPGDGGQPAQRQRFGGGAMSESERAGRRGDSGGGGGRGWGKLVGGAIFSEGEEDYAADSERSTDHELMHLYGGGGRESDEHDAAERDVFRRTRGRGSGAGVRRGRRRSSGGAGANAHRGRDGVGGGGDGGRGKFRASSPETCPDADGENTSGGNSAPGGEGPGAGGSPTSAPMLTSPKQPRIGTGIIGDSGGPRVGALLNEIGEQSGSLAHSEASGSGGGGGSVGEEEEEETERQPGKAADAEMRAREGEGGVGGNSDGGIGAAAPLEWEATLGRQPIFMSHGLPEEEPSLPPSHSEGGTCRTGSPGRSGVGGMSRPPPDPEDDRDRASSCSSADSPIPSSSIVRPGSRGGGGGGVSTTSVGKGTGQQLQTFAGEGASPACSPPPAASKLPSAPSNTPGGAVPWHHTSVYEANNPTEDRHAELSHETLGVKIYCVCDGHGGSRAAQFVCDHLVADVLARVESIASAATASTAGAGAPPTPPAPPPTLTQTPTTVAIAREQDKGGGSGAGGANNGVSDGVRERAGSGGDEWTGNEVEIRRSLADAFQSCDEQFIAQLDPTKNRGYINAGCCVVLALLVRSKLYVAHVGDCRLVLGTTDAARFSPSGEAPTSTGAGEGMAAVPVGKCGGFVGPGDGGSRGRNRGARGVAGGVTVGSRRAGSPLRGSAASIELDAVALSRDHNCDDGEEAALVRARSGDDNAIRVSRSDEWKGARAIKRVAGSLAVTRAIGDAYLKKAAFSFSPYKEGVPYITAEPAVRAIELTSKDRFLVLATDGVWEQVSNEEAVRCVSGALGSASGRRQRSTAGRTAGGGIGGTGSYSSDALVDLVLARSAQSHGMSVPALRALPRGSSRRMLHDDVCVTVIHLTPAPPQPATL
ncbi:unnamed protein product [Pylaiella littoralis]